MKIAVIDGQGGGIGKHITMALRKNLAEDTEIIGLGTNAIATTAMLKAGANEGATGESAIIHTAKKADIIIGSVSIIIAGSMCGEVTSGIVTAVGESDAKKYLLPISRSPIEIVGVLHEPVPHQIERLIKTLKGV